MGRDHCKDDSEMHFMEFGCGSGKEIGGHRVDQSASELFNHRPAPEPPSQHYSDKYDCDSHSSCGSLLTVAEDRWACDPYGHLGSLCQSWRGRWGHLQ